MINRVRGNALPLCIILTLDYKTSGGDVIEQYTPSASDMVAVALISYKSYPRQSVVENNYVKFDADNMPVGLYGIEVTINSGTVGEMRFYAREVLHIWESNSDMPADTDTIIKDDGSAVIVGATYYLAKGDVGLTGPQGEQGIQGTKGDKGDVGTTPQLKVIGNVWQVSYDNGATWASINAPASSLVRVNGSTKMWETSSDNGATWESTGVSAISSNAEVVQSAGTSTTAVMSQKAVGDYINSGARIGSLTETSSDDTWNLEFEVNDGSALTKKIKGSTLLNGLENTFSYGIEFDTAISSPNCTRIGNPELHRTLPIQSKMRRCLLDDSGTVVDYLDENDWSSNVLDGSKGQIMVELPKHYIKFETEGTKRRVRLSEYPLAGYHIVEKCYVSAFEATIDRTNNKLASVVNTTAQFRGGGNQSGWDGTFKSQLGKPATNISLTNFRAYARNRGSMGWNCYTYQIHREIYWLFAVEYATLNSQTAYNAALDANGYHQGGLGTGFATLGNWDLFGYYPACPCGTTLSLGNKTGVVTYTVKKSDDGSVATQDVAVACYRGVEHPFGDLWKWTDGILVLTQSEADGGLSKIYVCDTPSKFASSVGDGYDYRGNMPRTNGWVVQLILGEDGEIMPLAIGGGDTTYFGDYYYMDIPSSGTGTRGVLFGAPAVNGSSAGFVYANASCAPSTTNAYIGSRLCYVPNAE